MSPSSCKRDSAKGGKDVGVLVAWNASNPAMTEVNSAHVERSKQKIVMEDPVFQVPHVTLDSASAPNDTLKMVGYIR
jgi:tagatose-1,6-bisphosphate aldolase